MLRSNANRGAEGLRVEATNAEGGFWGVVFPFKIPSRSKSQMKLDFFFRGKLPVQLQRLQLLINLYIFKMILISFVIIKLSRHDRHLSGPSQSYK